MFFSSESGFKSVQEIFLFLDGLNRYGNNLLETKIENPDKHLELIQFCNEKIWFSDASINVFNVIGSRDCNWVNRNWKDIVMYGKRAQENAILLVQNPSYYLEKKIKMPSMSYIKIGSDIFVDNDGNHRTALAKLLFTKINRVQLDNVEVKDYKIDFKFKQLYEELYQIYFKKRVKFIIIKTTIGRDDGIAWYREFYSLRLKIVNQVNNKTLLLENADEMDMFKRELQNKSFMNRFKRNKFIDFIY